jgi:hypothetical protein
LYKLLTKINNNESDAFSSWEIHKIYTYKLGPILQNIKKIYEINNLPGFTCARLLSYGRILNE